MTATIRFYFSFRSTYSWLAFYRINIVAEALSVKFEYIPVFPTADFKNDPRLNKDKSDYMNHDVKRIAEAYGLPVKYPEPFDTDWKRPHAAYLYAVDQGKGIEFGLSAFSSRFSQGLDLGEERVIADVAEQCGLNPGQTLYAANERKFHHRLMQGMSDAKDDKLFGVPFFIYNGNRYWGNDRIEWLLRDVFSDMGSTAPSLVQDPLQRPF